MTDASQPTRATLSWVPRVLPGAVRDQPASDPFERTAMLPEARLNTEDDREALQRLLAATLHLMTAYATSDRQPCPLLAEMISRHLAEIARSSDSHCVLRATTSDLHDRWMLRAHVPPECPRRPWWMRAGVSAAG